MQTDPPFESPMYKAAIYKARDELKLLSLSPFLHLCPLSCMSAPDGNVPLERFDRILSETARRLSMLRGSVESPALGSKIQKLHSAAKEQQSRMSLIEQDLQEIREERDSLRDIALNLPESCPQATGAGKG